MQLYFNLKIHSYFGFTIDSYIMCLSKTSFYFKVICHENSDISLLTMQENKILFVFIFMFTVSNSKVNFHFCINESSIDLALSVCLCVWFVLTLMLFESRSSSHTLQTSGHHAQTPAV